MRATRAGSALVCLLSASTISACAGTEPNRSDDSDEGGGGIARTTTSGTGGEPVGGSGPGGMAPSECELGATEACYGGPASAAGVGACVMGVRSCEASGEFRVWGECLGWVSPGVETCGDGVDGNCDGAVDEGCCVAAAEICNGTDDDCDGAIDEDGVCDIASTCALAFPPPSGVPCDVATPGTQYYVSPTGDDAKSGTSPAEAWATLQHAVTVVPQGNTVRVAQGDYGPLDLMVTKELTIQGGYDAAFADWNPDVHATKYSGRLTLNHDAAVFAGFRMVANPQGKPNMPFEYYHRIVAGELRRNYVQIVFDGGADSVYFFAIVASADAGKTSRLSCNDIYVRDSGAGMWSTSAIEYGNLATHQGATVLDANRVCYDGSAHDHPREVVGGYGTCGTTTPATITLTNNVIENAHATLYGYGVEIYGCGDGDLSVTLTNNTVLSHGNGLAGYGASQGAGVVHWRLTNNVVAGYGQAIGAAAILGQDGVVVDSSEHNLTFGFATNGVLPWPQWSVGDDTNGIATQASVFVAPQSGDFHLSAAGPGVGTGLNVHGDAAYGSVTTDLEQLPRPAAGAWNRGALVP